jgi:hypothetical protein
MLAPSPRGRRDLQLARGQHGARQLVRGQRAEEEVGRAADLEGGEGGELRVVLQAAGAEARFQLAHGEVEGLCFGHSPRWSGLSLVAPARGTAARFGGGGCKGGAPAWGARNGQPDHDPTLR